MKKGLLLLCCVFLSLNLMAQTTGCLVVADKTVYTYNPRGEYDGTVSKVPLSGGYCSWTPSSTGTACSVCPVSLNNGGNCQGNGSNLKAGVYGSFTMVLCPLDDNIPFLIFAIAASSLFYLRLKKKVSLV